MFHYFHSLTAELSASILMVAPFALGPQNAGCVRSKSAPAILCFICHLDGPMESTEIVVPDTLPFTTTFSPANLSSCVLSPFKV
jgi:hypothetical protein